VPVASATTTTAAASATHDLLYGSDGRSVLFSDTPIR
jgi:hypothetical protein